MTHEQYLDSLQDDVKQLADAKGELWRQAMYQYLNGLGHRMPTDLRGNLLRLVRKEREVKP